MAEVETKIMRNCLDLPYLGFGMGLRPVHYPYIFENNPAIDWFEIISENYMDTEGPPIHNLAKIREKYPVVMHGVSMSIGTTDPVNSEYLKKLKSLADWLNPEWISDHLCWTGVAHKNVHDLLPVPYTEEALNHIIQRIKQVQDFLERPILIENPSTYLEFKSSEMPEWEFISRMSKESNCGLLLDINNIYVTCFNHRLDPKQYIDSIPPERVIQIHLAGHENKGKYILDTHEGKVTDEVWKLYEYMIAKNGLITTMIEWDTNIPDFPKVMEEVEKARNMATKAELPNMLQNFSAERENSASPAPYKSSTNWLQNSIFSGDIKNTSPDKWIRNKDNFPPEEQLNVYIDGYRFRLWEVLSNDLPVLRTYLGDKHTDRLIYDYIENTNSTNFNIARYITGLPEFIKHRFKLPILAGNKNIAYEIALLETNISQIFDMEETTPLSAGQYKNIAPEELLEMTFHPRKAMEILELSYDVNSYYQDVVINKKTRAKINEKENFLIIYRHNDVVRRLPLEKAEYKLLNLIFSGKTLGDSLEIFLENEDDELVTEVSEHLREWFSKWTGNALFSES